jgi:hypothetical protein
MEEGKDSVAKRDTIAFEALREYLVWNKRVKRYFNAVWAGKTACLTLETVSILEREMRYSLGLGGGSSRATTVSANPQVLWDPSQKGLFAECPHRQRAKVVRPASPNVRPSGSTISKSPSMRSDPLWFTVILVAAIFSPAVALDVRN